MQQSGETRAELHGAMNNIKDTLSKSSVSPAFRSLICYLSFSCSTPIYYLSRPQYSQFSPYPPESAQQSRSLPVPILTELQTQFHDIQTSRVSHVNKARALEGVIAKHDTIKREISVLRELVEKTTTMKSSGDNENGRDGEEEGEKHSGGVSAEIDKDSRHIRTIVPHELEGSKGE